MKHINAFKDFLLQEVNLNQSRIDTLEQKINSITKLLKDDFSGYRKTEKQGSYAMKTIIKPVKENNEFDADILIYINKNNDMEPKAYIQDLYDFFKANQNYNHLTKRKTRCVTLDHAGDFHIDLVPCYNEGEKTYICNFEENAIEQSDGTGYQEWLKVKTAYTNGELKRITRLMKFMRDHKQNLSVKSILLTTLLGNSVEDISADKFLDTPTALLKIMDSLNNFLQLNPQMPIIKNPVLPEENFNRHWDQAKYDNFRGKINLYYEKIKDAYFDENHNSSIKKWRKVFGDKFGKLKENKGSGPVIEPRKPHSIG